MRKSLRWSFLIAGAVVIAGAAYGTGAGWFYPCGPVDSLLRYSNCRVIERFDGATPEALLVETNGQLLVALRGAGQDPTTPQHLVTVSAAGDTIADIALSGVEPGMSWMKAALSPDGTRIAAAIFDGPVTVLDRQTGGRLTTIDVFSAGFVGFDGADRLLVDRGAAGFETPLSGTAAVFAIPSGEAAGQASGAEVAPIFANGIAAAMSADGTLIAQHLETAADSGIVAIRITDAASSGGGRLLVASLAAGRRGRHLLPELSFSPDGRRLAASFDSPSEWGRVTSALIIWSIESEEVIARVPTTAEWRSIEWLPEGRGVALTRFYPDKRRGELALIRF